MFGSSILEVAIGLIFIYLLLSLIISIINEYIATALNKRGENLFEGIKNLLNDPTFTGLAQKLYNHGLIDGISQPARNPNKPSRRPSYMASETFTSALLDILKSRSADESWKELEDQRKLELEDARAQLEAYPRDAAYQQKLREAQLALEQVQKVLPGVDALKQAYVEAEWAAGKVLSPKDIGNLRAAREKLEKALTIGRVLAAQLPDPLGNIQRAIQLMPAGNTKESLLVMIDNARQEARVLDPANPRPYEMQLLEEKIKKWFNDAMDRVGGWYKRWTQRILFLIAIVLVLAVNADTLMLIKRFSRDGALRASLVTAATNAVQEGVPNPVEDKTARENLLREAAKLTLPIGWIPNSEDPYKHEQVPICRDVPLSQCLGGWSLKLAGLLISVLATQLGAPFWFDSLNKVTNLRGSGAVPKESAKDNPNTAGGTIELATVVAMRPRVGSSGT